MFYFPGTAALLLRTQTWMSDVAIANALRNYGQHRVTWWILTRRADHKSYRLVPTQGGWLVFLECRREIRALASIEH